MSNLLDQDRCRADVLAIFGAALAAVHGGRCVQRYLTTRPLRGDMLVVAIGKAAGAMMEGGIAALGTQLCAALVITKEGHANATRLHATGVTVWEAGHPLPDERSVQAGQALLDFIAALPGDAQLLFLISGGASSLVEVLPPGVTLDDLRRVNEWLLASGWDIHRINALRKRLSCIKGGRLAAHLQGRKVLQLLISDVPGDRSADIGSGLLVADEEALIVESALPLWLQTLLKSTRPSPRKEESSFAKIETHIIASLDQALGAAAQQAWKLGYAVQLHAERLSGDALIAGRRLAAELMNGPAGVHIWGGETAVELPFNPGRGGRNQPTSTGRAKRSARSPA